MIFSIRYLDLRTVEKEKTIRIILITSFILNILSFILYSIKYGIDRSYRFEVASITINWITAIVIGILISRWIRKKLKGES